MALQDHDLPINFAGGIDTKSDPWQLAPNEFISLNNMVYTTGGRLTKRNGFPSLGNSVNTPAITYGFSNIPSSITSGRKIFSYKNELCLNDAFNLYSYDEANNAWNYKGRSTMVELSSSDIAQDINSKTNMDVSIDTTSGIKVFAWDLTNAGFNTVQYSIQDSITGQFIVNKATFGTSYKTPRCVSIAGKSWIFATNTTDGKIYYLAIIGQAVSGSPTALITDLNATYQNFDVDVSDGNIYIAYYTSGPAVKIDQLNSSMAIVNSISKSESATNGVSFFGDGTNIWIVYNNGSATKAFIVNNAVTSTVLAPTVVDSGAGASNVQNVTGCWSSTQSKAFIFYDQTSTDIRNVIHSLITFNTLTVGGTAGTATIFIRSLLLVSKAFAVSGIPHVATIYTSINATIPTIQQTYFLLNLYNLTPSAGQTPYGDVAANIVSKIAADQAGIQNTPGFICGAHNPSGSIWDMALGQKTVLQTALTSTYITSTVGVIDAQFDFSLSNPDVQCLGNNALIATGQLSSYDGASINEQNFHIYPEAITAAIATSGGFMGSASANTLYGYQFTYEWVDNEGQVNRSTPSATLSPLASGEVYTFASGTTTGEITLTIPTLRVTNKPGGTVSVNVYRTIGNGTVYYLTGSTIFTVTNDSSVDSVTYVDKTSDEALVLGIQLYTTGEVDDFAIPPASALTTFKNRILAVSAETGYDFYYSKQVQIGFPVEFSQSFDQNVGSVAGSLTAIAGMDDKIILFKSGLSVGPSILYMVGTGPAASGANNDFTDPLPVAVDCGCVDRASIVLTGSGLIFKTDKGIYLLDRNLSPSYIGAPVEEYNQYDVLSSQLIPNTTQARFILSNGMMLMYDYFYGKWTTWTPPAGVSDCIFQGQHTFLSSSGLVYKESPGTYYDGTNTPVLMSFTTANFNLANVSGYQRIRDIILLAKYISPHQIQMQINYEYGTYGPQSVTITPNGSVLEQFRIQTKQQLCQSFQLIFNEIYTGTLGASLTITGMTLRLALKAGVRPIPGASSSGLS